MHPGNPKPAGLLIREDAFYLERMTPTSRFFCLATIVMAAAWTGLVCGACHDPRDAHGDSQATLDSLQQAASAAVMDSGMLTVFPGAEGTGTTTRAGRRGRVIRVTSLGDTGPGTLRAALATEGPRVVVFEIAGVITLSSNLVIEHPFVTVAGQTAPSPGITVTGATLVVGTHDVLIQHIRIRVGDDPTGPSPGSRDALRLLGEDEIYNIVIDHISASWAIDELFSIYNSRDVTVRHSIFSEALNHSLHPEGAHSKGVFLAEGTHAFTFIGNLVAHNEDRNPAIKGNTSTILVNNVIYNWGNGAAIPMWDSRSNPTFQPIVASIVGNVFIAGGDTPSRAVCVEVNASVARGTQVFLADNAWRRAKIDPWSIAEIDDVSFDVKAGAPPLWTSLTLRASDEVEAWVLANAGARPADRDAVDARLVREVQSRVGRIIDRPEDVGGWPTMPEVARPLSLPEEPDEDEDGDGYTNLEEWLHEMAAAVEVPPER